MTGINVLVLVAQSGPVAKGVLLILFFFSVTSWAIIFMKLRMLKRAERESQAFLRLFRDTKNLAATYEEARKFPASPVASLFREGFRELGYRLKGNPGVTNPEPARSTLMHTEELSHGLDRILRQATLKEVGQLERHLTFLATTGSAAPFIGLFGTVWGIIDAFAAIGAAGSANLGAVAPGIAEALIATAAGLFAAIPAVIAYNHFVNRIRIVGTLMDLFSLEFHGVAERVVVKGKA
ncbi:MAG: protein TolQ [Candidatus Methylomirabilales bacterium]